MGSEKPDPMVTSEVIRLLRGLGLHVERVDPGTVENPGVHIVVVIPEIH